MNRLACLALLVAAVATAADKPDPKADLAALKGKWKVTATTFDGKAIQLPKAERVLDFDDKQFTAFDGDTSKGSLGFTVDVTTTPKRIDLDRPGQDKKAAGLYKLDGDKLTICYSEWGAERPEKLESKVGGKTFLLELERVKK